MRPRDNETGTKLMSRDERGNLMQITLTWIHTQFYFISFT